MNAMKTGILPHWVWEFIACECCWGMLNLSTGECTLHEVFSPEPFVNPAEHYEGPGYWRDTRTWSDDPLPTYPPNAHGPQVKTASTIVSPYDIMAADGDFFGSHAWTAAGNRRAAPLSFQPRAPAHGGQVGRQDGYDWHVARPDGSILWSLPTDNVLTGYGGESTRGEASWVLVSSPDGYHFRDFRTGAVLGAWAGSMPVMVSAGIIYDTDDDGNLRRWTE